MSIKRPHDHEDAIDVAIARVAHRQRGLITHEQLIALGLGARAIAYRVRVGKLIRLHVGVYAVGHVPSDPLALDLAAVLACGERAALSHHSAGVCWKQIGRYHGHPEVSVPSKRARPRIRVHRSSTLTKADITSFRGIPITTPPRTLLDLTPSLPDLALTRALSDSITAGYLRLNELSALLARQAHTPGARRLIELIGEFTPTDSVLEDTFRAFLKTHDLPEALYRQILFGWRVDALFPNEQVIVELDGARYHTDPGAFERDRERDSEMLKHGYITIRITWSRLLNQPAREAKRLHTILNRRRKELGLAPA